MEISLVNRDELIGTIYENTSTIRRGMFDRLQQVTPKLPISPAQLHLLFLIKQQQPINAKQLALKLQLTPGAVSQLVESLVSHHLITKTPSPTDRRIHNLQLTATAVTSLESVEKHRRAAMEQVMQSLSTEELTVWLKAQEKLIEAWKPLPVN